MLTFKSTGKPAKIYYTTPDTKYMPAKMMYGENMATGYDMITETGETVTLLGDYNKGLVSLQINGKSTQDGTPTPDNPVEVESVGDKTKNLIPYPYSNTTKTVNGVTWTDNGDGTITASGTATDYTSFSMVYKKQGVIQPNKEYVFSRNGTDDKNVAVDILLYDKDGNSTRSVNENSSFTTAENEELITINLKRSVSGYSVGGTFKPQLEEGSTATEYEPYHKYKVPVVMKGKNLFDVTTSYTNYANEDGGITFSNTDFPTINNLSISGFENNIVYSISGKYEVTNANNNSAFIVVYYTDGTTKSFWNCYGGIITGDKSGNFSVQTISNKSIDRIKLAMYTTSVRTYNIKLSNIQIEVGSSATEYEPYIPSVTTNIYLDEPLRGIGNYRDYIDLKNGRVVRRIGVMTLDGDESALYTFTSTRPQEGYSCYRYVFSVAQGTWACLCDKIPYKEFGYSVATSGTCISLDSRGRNLIFKIPTEWASTLDEFKAWLAANPCTVYYVIGTKTETVLPDSVREELLSINTEYGKTKTLTVTGTDMTVEQCKLNTQEV